LSVLAQAPHQGDEELIYPGTCRPPWGWKSKVSNLKSSPTSQALLLVTCTARSTNYVPNWRFRVPDGEAISFTDGYFGTQQFVAGKDFGDFVVWRHDDVPAYQLAVVADDAAMQITEAVRGADLLVSTARQLLVYRALGWRPLSFSLSASD
jgi:glutamyl-tRNA synthetase